MAGSLTVLWDHSPDSHVAGYLVSYGTQPGRHTATVKTGYVTSVNVGGLTSGTRYYFVVQSFDRNNILGPPSPEINGVVPSAGPSITCPSPVLTSLDGKPLAVTLTPTVVGGVAPVSTTCTPPSGSLFPVGTTSFSCTAVDALQQKASCASKVVVMSSAPAPTPTPTVSPLTITCPRIAPVTANGGSEKAIVRYDDPTSTGGVAPVTLRCQPKSGSAFPVGRTTVECRARDAVDTIVSCTTTAVVRAGK